MHELVRIINSLKYESFLAEQISRLVEDREMVITQLQNQATQTITSISTKVQQIAQQLELLDTPRERDLRTFLDGHDGPEACIKNGDALQELLQKSGESIEGVLGHQSGFNGSWSEASEAIMKQVQEVLLKEMAENVEEAFEKHFKKILDLHGQQLTEIKFIRETNERILLGKGAYDETSKTSKQMTNC